jgi:hypothetical protein
MSAEQSADDAVILREIAAEIHHFIRAHPNHYAARALAGVVNREVAGEPVDDGERELVLMTLLREAKAQSRRQRFSRE